MTALPGETELFIHPEQKRNTSTESSHKWESAEKSAVFLSQSGEICEIYIRIFLTDDGIYDTIFYNWGKRFFIGF